MSRRFVLLAGLAYLLILLGLFTRHGGLLALAIPLVVYLGAALLDRPPQPVLTGERHIHQNMVRQNTPVEVILTIHNQGADLDELTLEAPLVPGLVLLEGHPRVLTSLPAGESIDLRYVVSAARGKFSLPDVGVTVSDSMGIQRSHTAIPAQARLVFLPEIYHLRQVSIRPRRTHGHFGPIPSRKTGSGVDFYGLREYQVGDPRRWINWRASMRHNEQLYVNQFEQERIADVGIILDARSQSDIIQPGGDRLFEYGVRAAGSLSKALLDDGNRVGLLIYGFGMERVFPGYGKVQQERIVYALGQARTGHNFALESLGALPARFFPAASQIVMISPLLQEDLPAFARLRSAGFEILVVSPDPVTFEAHGLGIHSGVALRIARVERALLLRKLQRMGIRVLDWPVDRPFEALVRAALSRVSPAMQMGLRSSGGQPT